MRTPLSLAIAALVITAPVHAQSQSTIPLQVNPASRLSLDGTSTMHDFTCQTSDIQAEVEVDSAYGTMSLEALTTTLKRADVTIPVTSLTCGDRRMDKNMYKTLEADAHPDIRYTLVDTEVVPGSAAGDSIALKVNGQLTIAGETRPVTLDVEVIRARDGSARGRGAIDIRMSDFGIEPPSFFFGRLKVGDRIAIHFDLAVSAPAVVATRSR